MQRWLPIISSQYISSHSFRPTYFVPRPYCPVQFVPYQSSAAFMTVRVWCWHSACNSDIEGTLRYSYWFLPLHPHSHSHPHPHILTPSPSPSPSHPYTLTIASSPSRENEFKTKRQRTKCMERINRGTKWFWDKMKGDELNGTKWAEDEMNGT
jgi:hypothetical protein